MSGVEMLDKLAVDWHLPADPGIDVLDTRVLKHFHGNPGEYFVRDGLVDEYARMLLERDLQDAYAKRFYAMTGLRMARPFDAESGGFQVLNYCRSHDLPVCTKDQGPSPVTHTGIWECLKFDLRLAAKYADDDARVFSEKRHKKQGFVGRLLLGGAFVAGVFFASYFGVSLAINHGIDRAKAEIDSYVVPKFHEELRDGIDVNVQRYVGSFLMRGADNDGSPEEGAVRKLRRPD